VSVDRATLLTAPLVGCNVLLDGRPKEPSRVGSRQMPCRANHPKSGAAATEAWNPTSSTLTPTVHARRNARIGTWRGPRGSAVGVDEPGSSFSAVAMMGTPPTRRRANAAGRCAAGLRPVRITRTCGAATVSAGCDPRTRVARPHRRRTRHPNRRRSTGRKAQPKSRLGLVRLTSAFQPRRLMIAPAAVGCKRLLDGVPGATVPA